jgi:ABC-type proline/glycine betaine transport system permease subunit
MQKLRSIHLYLGCIFAPLLLFFALSGIWQTLGLNSRFLEKLSSIHTERRWKDGSELGSFPLRVFVIIMAVSFIISIILGVIMAFKFGRSRRAALYCLALGVTIPSVLVLLRIIR